MPAPLLYTYRRCPYAMRARMALLQAGVAYQPHEVSLRDKPPAMLALSPKGTVPVLVLPNGVVLEQSLDIMRWAFEQSGDTDHGWARAQTSPNLALQQACDGPFKHHLDRYKYPQRFADAMTREHHFQQAVAVLLEPLEQELHSQPQLGGASPCASDIGIFPFVRQFAAVDPERFEGLPLPAVKAWLAAWLGSGLFTEAMRKSAL
ncbi:glutathione S-transferase [Limnohabitans sp.]|uniref:glutathione S-transferase n=1 Tax=Limnohabitans sp. TaxID=1907725 RepID=UPI0038BA4EA9